VTLLLMGSFMLASLSLETFMAYVQEEALVTAFVRIGTPEAEVRALTLRITAFEEVAQVDLVPPERALNELFTDPTDRNLLQIGGVATDNPLPYTIRLKVRSGQNLPGLIDRLKQLPGVESVSYGEEALRQIQGLSDLIWVGSLLITILLGLASLFIVANTVRLTLTMRREEIVIMKLVGATNWFVRWPFIMEGFLQGLLGAALAIIVLSVGSKFILTRLAILIPFFPFQPAAGHLAKLSVKLLLTGVVLGLSGSLLSLRNLRELTNPST
jgi:cell division transport system permease protein